MSLLFSLLKNPRKYLPEVVGSSMDSARRGRTRMSNTAAEIIQKCLALSLLAWASLLFSIFSYGTFYYCFMPKVSFSVPLFLQYDHKCLDLSRESYSECLFPKASFSLLHNETRSPFFALGQTYQLLLQIEVPENEVNTKIGLFMMSLDLFVQEERQKPVHTVRRSGALSFKSQLLRDLETIVLLPFYVGGYKRQAQTLLIDLGRFTPPSDTLKNAVATLESRDVIAVSAEFIALAKFSGIRYWLYFYPITIAFIAIWILFSIFFPFSVTAYFRCSSVESVNMLYTHGQSRLAHNTTEDRSSTLVDGRAPLGELTEAPVTGTIDVSEDNCSDGIRNRRNQSVENLPHD